MAEQQSYNAIHFTPIQKYGASYSHYSIADQTEFDDYFFKSPPGAEETKGPIDKQEKFTRVQNVVQSLKEDHGLIGIVDIVLNHTANNSEWI